MDYFKYEIAVEISLNEILIALLSDLPLDTFEETDTGFSAFLPVSGDTAEVEARLASLAERFPFSYKKELIPYQNWNQLWESNFHPVVVGSFCGIRADFHEPLKGVEIELVINPKMAFGTGHHETTWMVIDMMQDIDFRKKTVLDYGCGTGVLGILAGKLGALQINALDIEEQSFLNTIENSERNGVANLEVFQGKLDVAPAGPYDLILANINRNVILDSLSSLSRSLKQGGVLIVSGFLKEDEALLQNALVAHHFTLIRTNRKNNWLAMQASKGA